MFIGCAEIKRWLQKKCLLARIKIAAICYLNFVT